MSAEECGFTSKSTAVTDRRYNETSVLQRFLTKVASIYDNIITIGASLRIPITAVILHGIKVGGGFLFTR